MLLVGLAVVITIFLAFRLSKHMCKETEKSENLFVEKIQRENQCYSNCDDINRFVKTKIEYDESKKLECSEINIVILDLRLVELCDIKSRHQHIQCDDYYEGRRIKKGKSKKHKHIKTGG